MEEADLSNGFRILDATNSTFDETWMPVWGEYEKVRNHYNELTVTLSQPAKHDRMMIVRFDCLTMDSDSVMSCRSRKP